MTNERDKADMDARVSETYRELSAPRVPDHLNQRILRMAANQGPGMANSLFKTWIKPVTVAATIALSLAIVLELTELPTAAVQMEVAPAVDSQAESVREEITPQETDSLGRADGRARSQFGRSPMPVREDESSSADGLILEELVLKDTDPAKSEAKGKIDSFAASPAAAALPAARKRAADVPDSNQPAAMSLDSDQVVAERLIATEPVASIEITDAAKESSVAATCDEIARQSADTWLECIDKMRESGLTLDADREYEVFMLEYPAEAASLESNK